MTYLLPTGEPLVKTYTAGAQQPADDLRRQDEDPRLANTPVSMIVESTNNQPVVVERAMWWPSAELVRGAPLRRHDDHGHELGARRRRGDAV